jgi:hypothetical protein
MLIKKMGSLGIHRSSMVSSQTAKNALAAFCLDPILDIK